MGFVANQRLEKIVSQASDVETQRQELLFKLLVNFDKVRVHNKRRCPKPYELAHRVYILQNMGFISSAWKFDEPEDTQRIYDTTLLHVDLERLEKEGFISCVQGYRVNDVVRDNYLKGKLDLEGKTAPEFVRIVERAEHRVVDDLAKILYFAQHGQGKVNSIKSRAKCSPYQIDEGRYDQAMVLYEKLRLLDPKKQRLL